MQGNRVLPTENENARFLGFGSFGCRVLLTGYENARLLGVGIAECRVLSTGHENARLLGFGIPGYRVLSTALENAQTLEGLGSCGRITRSFRSLGQVGGLEYTSRPSFIPGIGSTEANRQPPHV